MVQRLSRRNLIAAVAVLSLAAGAPLAAQDPSGVENGLRLYAIHCAACHGTGGDAVAGVDFRTGRFRVASSDDDLRRVIAFGLPGTGMPPHRLDGYELSALVAYVRLMRDSNARGVAIGDAARGRALFEGRAGCANCHRVNGKGSRVAPDLSDVGVTRAAESLQGTLVDPTRFMRPINRPVRAVTRDGKVIDGRRLNEDTYTVQLIDDQERLVSLVKADLREYTIVKTSPMPSYEGKLSPEELADLVAYLVTLKGSP